MTKDEILDLMKKHDWTFEWSDDGKTYNRGMSQRITIFNEAKKAEIRSDEFREMIAGCVGNDKEIMEQWEVYVKRVEL